MEAATLVRQVFPRWFDTLTRAGMAGVVLSVPCVSIAIGIFYRSDYATGRHDVYQQAVPLSHRHHVGQLGIDCRYCHTGVEDSSFAGLPPTETCMNCHEEIWVGSQMLAPVRNSWKSGEPLHWTRVNSLPQYVYFNHSIHIAKGVGCVLCHGKVDQMPLTYQDKPMTMGWCLDCHRDPAPNLRPHSEVFNIDWVRTSNTPSPAELMEEYHVKDSRALTSCSTCHR